MRFIVAALALALLLTQSTASAQTAGVLAGVNFATTDVSGDSDVDSDVFDRRTGLVVGLFANIPLSDSFSLQPEVLYSQKGAKVEEDPGTFTLEVDYLDIPVLARVTAGGQTGLVLFAGPSFGFKMRARAKGEFEGETEEEDVSDEVETLDIGLIAGVGFQGARFLIDGRYQWGLSNINKVESDPAEVKNRVISIVVGWQF